MDNLTEKVLAEITACLHLLSEDSLSKAGALIDNARGSSFPVLAEADWSCEPLAYA